MNNIIFYVPLFFLVGCSSGGGTGPSSRPDPGSQQVAEALTGRIVVTSVLARSIPANITGLRFRGLSASGEILYGPQFRTKAPVIVLEGVPLGVQQLEIEYYENSILRGRGVTPVVVQANGETLVNEPGYVDVTYALTSLSVEPAEVVLERGQTQIFQVEGSYADNTTLDITESVVWTSSNVSVAEVVGSQLFARGVGNCSLTAQVGNVSGSASVRVLPPRLVGVSLSPSNVTLLEGGRLNYLATGSFSDNTQEELSNVTWSSSLPEVAEITAAGNLTARAPGVSLIQVSSGGMTANTSLTVAVNATLLNLEVRPSGLDIPKGMNVQFKAFGSYVNGTQVDLTQSATFSSDAPLVLISTGVERPRPLLDWISSLGDESAASEGPPPPKLANFASSVFGANSLGVGNVVAEFDGLVGRASVRVTAAVPQEAQALPLQVDDLQNGQSLVLSTRTLMTDGSVELDRVDTQLQSEGPVTLVGNLVNTVGAGLVRFSASVPALPTFPYALDEGTSFTSYLGFPAPDYLFYRQDPPGAVVSRDLGLRFSVQGPGDSIPVTPATTLRRGVRTDFALFEDSADGPFSANDNMLQGPRRSLTLPKTRNLLAIARGRFSGQNRIETFFAGQGEVDYGVLLADPPGALPILPGGPPQYAEFSDAPDIVGGAAVADFDGNGRDDAAIVSGTKLLVRLSKVGVLDEAQPLLELGATGGQVRSGDLNGDGKLDLVIAQGQGFRVLLGEGAGSFRLGASVSASRGGSEFRLGDVDGDGFLDVFFLYHRGQGNRFFTLAYGDGNGNFPRLVEGELGFRVHSARLADLTGDGLADLAVVASRNINGVIAPPGNALLCVYPGSGSGLLSPQVVATFERNGPGPFVLRDDNGDSRLDFVGQLVRWQNVSFVEVGPALGNFWARRLP